MSIDEQWTDRMWLNPPSVYRSAPFWSWNGRLEPDRLTRQIEQMHLAGMGGFFMHSRYGLKTPYLSEEWFACVAACVEQARRLGMKAYLYDEDRWPSGTAGGAVTRRHADYRWRHLAAHDPSSECEPTDRLAMYEVNLDEAGSLKSYRAAEQADSGLGPAGGFVAFDIIPGAIRGWWNDGTYLDTMNAEAVAEFIHETHQAYADRHGEDFGGVIPAIFTDEPNYGSGSGDFPSDLPHLPWTPDLPDQFKRRRGYDLLDRLPELFFSQEEGEFSKIRCDYYRTITEMFTENYTAQIGRWCGEHGIVMTGHMNGEQTLRWQILCIGAAMPHYEHMYWPGIDVLGDQADELLTARQCSSVAAQLGKQRVLSELYGCTGWDWPLEGHKFVGDWQYACGVNLRCPHLTHYSLAGGAKRDYPASIFSHSPWWKYYKVVEDYFARLSVALTQGRAVRDVLVIHPIESAWGLFLPSGRDQNNHEVAKMDEGLRRLVYALSGEHYDWDLGDESLLARHAEVAGPSLKVGLMSYKVVIVPPSVTLRATTADLLREFIAGGGQVLFVGRRPDHIDAEKSDEICELAAQSQTCGDAVEEFIPALESALPRRVSITENGSRQRCIWYMLRAVEGGQLLFVQSHDRRSGHDLHVSVRGQGPVVFWDAVSGRKERIDSNERDGRVEFGLRLAPTGSALLSLGLSVPDAEQAGAVLSVRETRAAEGPFDIELTEPNTLPLDYCQFAIGDEDFSEPMPTLKADALIRARFGLAARSNREHQPWYLYATGEVDTEPRGRCRMRRTFHATDLPARCALALEGPQDYRITVNGRPVPAADGWWVDEDIRTIDIAALVRIGENEILIAFDYRADMELEDMYLVGDFGVSASAGGRRAPGGMTLTAPPGRLRIGSWVGQGLDFYGGAVRYRIGVPDSVCAAAVAGRRVRLALPAVKCTAAAIHVGKKTFVLPWPPMSADITDALAAGTREVHVEVIGGRKNILGPLHTPWGDWTGPEQFNPGNPDWTDEYLLTDHGLTAPPVFEVLQ